MKFVNQAVLCTFALLATVQLDAQTTRDVCFDFSTKKISNPEELRLIKSGDYLVVHVKNFNPFLYQVQIDFADSTIHVNQAPGLFNSFFNTSDLTGLLSNLGETLLKVFPRSAPSSQVGGAFGIRTREDSINKEILSFRNSLAHEKLAMIQLKRRIEDYLFDQNVQLLITKKWNIKRTDLVPFTKDSQAAFIQSVKAFYLSKDSIVERVFKASNDYETNNLTYRKLIDTTSTLREMDSLMTLSQSQVLQSLTVFDTTYAYSKFETVLTELINLDEDNFNYTSLPVQIKQDFSDVSISLTPWVKEDKIPSYKASWEFPLNRKSYFNFSTNFYISGLYNDNYYATQKVSTSRDTSYVIGQENGSGVEIGIAALFHVGWYLNSSQSTSFQLTFGPGLSLQKKPVPRLLTGLGLGFGKKNKFIISTGLILGEVYRLRKYYIDNPEVKFSPTDLTTPILKPSLFFTLGYSIF